MQDQIAAAEDWNLKFARQFYASCLERLGEDHVQTRGLLQYISSLEYPLASINPATPIAAAARPSRSASNSRSSKG
jgi:hypothetical protein